MIDVRKLQAALGVPSASALRQVALPRPRVRKPSLRRGYRHFYAVPKFQAFAYRSHPDAVGPTRRSSIGIINPGDGDRAQVALVLSKLLHPRCPAAVAGLVVSGRVNAVDREATRRSLPHVLQERHERGIPTLANADASPPILGEVLEFGIFAAPLHSNPDAVGRAAFPAAFVAVNQSSVRISHSRLNTGRPLKGQGK